MSKFQGDARARRHEGATEHRHEADDHRHKPTVPSSRTAQEKLRQWRAQMSGQQTQSAQNQIRRSNPQTQGAAAQNARPQGGSMGSEPRTQDQQPIDPRNLGRQSPGAPLPGTALDQGLASETIDLKAASFEPKAGSLFGAIRHAQSVASQSHVASVFPGEISGAAKAGDGGEGSSNGRGRLIDTAFTQAQLETAHAVAKIQFATVLKIAKDRVRQVYAQKGDFRLGCVKYLPPLAER